MKGQLYFMNDNEKIFDGLLKICRAKEMLILFAPFKANYGMVCKNRIGIANDMDLENINKTLAHEIAHTFLHYDKGNILNNKSPDYEEQADRAASMLLEVIQILGHEGEAANTKQATGGTYNG